MSELPGVLGDYATVGMAVEMLGYRREQTGRFYALVKKGMPTYKVGGMTLAKASELAEFAGKQVEVSWPAKLASLKMEFLHSRNDAANILGVAPRTVNRYANAGTIKAVDLSPWGGYTLYSIGTTTPYPEYLSIDGWTIEAEIDGGGKLNVVIVGEGAAEMFAMTGMGSRPKKVFFHEDTINPAVLTVRVAESLHG